MADELLSAAKVDEAATYGPQSWGPDHYRRFAHRAIATLRANAKTEAVHAKTIVDLMLLLDAAEAAIEYQESLCNEYRPAKRAKLQKDVKDTVAAIRKVLDGRA